MPPPVKIPTESAIAAYGFNRKVGLKQRFPPNIVLAGCNWGLRPVARQTASDFVIIGSVTSLDFIPGGGARAPTNPAPVLSQANNGTAIAGQVLTIVQNQNVEIGEPLTTAIGALNAGSVNPRSAP